MIARRTSLILKQECTYTLLTAIATCPMTKQNARHSSQSCSEMSDTTSFSSNSELLSHASTCTRHAEFGYSSICLLCNTLKCPGKCKPHTMFSHFANPFQVNPEQHCFASPTAHPFASHGASFSHMRISGVALWNIPCPRWTFSKMSIQLVAAPVLRATTRACPLITRDSFASKQARTSWPLCAHCRPCSLPRCKLCMRGL